MNHLGDFIIGAEVCDTFTTVNTSGVPTQFIGSVAPGAQLAVFKGASSIVSAAGSSVTLTCDLTTTTGNKLNGFNHWRIVTAGCGFFTCGNYSVIIACGTVGGSAVWGTKIGSFSLAARPLTCEVLGVIRCDIWTAATRTLTSSSGITASIDCATMGAIGCSVWRVSDRTLTSSSGITASVGCDTIGVIAHDVLNSPLSRTVGTGRDVGNALRPLRNKWSVCGLTYTTTKEDDTTTAWTSVLDTTPGTTPVTGSDPA